MPSRAEIVRHVMEEDWIGGLREYATDDFAIEGDGGIRLGFVKRAFFPDLTVTLEELAELDDDRIFARFTIRSRDQAGALRWPAVGIFRFRGDRLASVWSVMDHLPWLVSVGAVDREAMERRFDEAAAETAAGNDASPPL